MDTYTNIPASFWELINSSSLEQKKLMLVAINKSINSDTKKLSKTDINYSDYVSHIKKFLPDDYFKEEHTAGLIWHNRLAKSWGKIHYTPYMDEKVKNFFYEKDWYELNKPKQKHHVRTGYQAELNRIGGAKPHANLQLESGVDKVFENLLLDPQINYKRRTRVMDLCRDWKCYTNPIL